MVDFGVLVSEFRSLLANYLCSSKNQAARTRTRTKNNTNKPRRHRPVSFFAAVCTCCLQEPRKKQSTPRTSKAKHFDSLCRLAFSLVSILCFDGDAIGLVHSCDHGIKRWVDVAVKDFFINRPGEHNAALFPVTLSGESSIAVSML